MSTPIERMIDAAAKCLKCGAAMGTCECWAPRWGLFDTVDGGFLGDEDGPLSWAQRDIADAARTVHSIRFGFDGTRLEVRDIGHGSFTRTGDFPPPLMDGHDALLIAEGERPRKRRRR